MESEYMQSEIERLGMEVERLSTVVNVLQVEAGDQRGMITSLQEDLVSQRDACAKLITQVMRMQHDISWDLR